MTTREYHSKCIKDHCVEGLRRIADARAAQWEIDIQEQIIKLNKYREQEAKPHLFRWFPKPAVPATREDAEVNLKMPYWYVDATQLFPNDFGEAQAHRYWMNEETHWYYVFHKLHNISESVIKTVLRQCEDERCAENGTITISAADWSHISKWSQ